MGPCTTKIYSFSNADHARIRSWHWRKGGIWYQISTLIKLTTRREKTEKSYYFVDLTLYRDPIYRQRHLSVTWTAVKPRHSPPDAASSPCARSSASSSSGSSGRRMPRDTPAPAPRRRVPPRSPSPGGQNNSYETPNSRVQNVVQLAITRNIESFVTREDYVSGGLKLSLHPAKADRHVL